ncbi:MAG: hypothetical protein IT534_06215 [Bauldia sp.]|nr:hypothetical protein [Bauldia sp.]
MKHLTIATAAATALIVGTAPVLAQHVAEIVATEEQRTAVAGALADISCNLRADTIVEWEEEAGLFEVDDAPCAFGQYDVKLNADYTIRSLTFDGPTDAAGAPPIMATPEELAALNDVLAGIGCAINAEAGVERETRDMYELDDVQCVAGQFDIKMDEFYTIITMTRD